MVLRWGLGFLAAWILSGCGIRASIEDLTPESKLAPLSTPTGMSSGATAVEVVNGYKVSTSLGSHFAGVRDSQSGYKVYLSVQGATTGESSP